MLSIPCCKLQRSLTVWNVKNSLFPHGFQRSMTDNETPVFPAVAWKHGIPSFHVPSHTKPCRRWKWNIPCCPGTLEIPRSTMLSIPSCQLHRSLTVGNVKTSLLPQGTPIFPTVAWKHGIPSFHGSMEFNHSMFQPTPHGTQHIATDGNHQPSPTSGTCARHC
jgi:hypothetical protein